VARFFRELNTQKAPLLPRGGKGGLGEIRVCAFGSLTAAGERPADGGVPLQPSTSSARFCSTREQHTVLSCSTAK